MKERHAKQHRLTPATTGSYNTVDSQHIAKLCLPCGRIAYIMAPADLSANVVSIVSFQDIAQVAYRAYLYHLVTAPRRIVYVSTIMYHLQVNLASLPQRRNM